MSHAPRITVVIPSLDQALYLERAICSVLDQGYENLELMVIDGGSTDQSTDIIRAYENDIDHWQSAWDSGPAEAINTALTWATGDILAILDADDAYLPHALHEAARAFQHQTQWVIGQAICVDEDDEHLADLPAEAPRNLADFLLRDGEPFASSACFYRTDALKAIGGFESRFKLAYTHELHARLYAAGHKPAILRTALAAIRDHEAALSITHALTCGHEFIESAERYAPNLAPTHRARLRRNSEERRRIYDAAHAEMRGNERLRTRWQQLLKRPWWLGNDEYRRNLLKSLVKAGTSATPAKQGKSRRAA